MMSSRAHEVSCRDAIYSKNLTAVRISRRTLNDQPLHVAVMAVRRLTWPKNGCFPETSVYHVASTGLVLWSMSPIYAAVYGADTNRTLESLHVDKALPHMPVKFNYLAGGTLPSFPNLPKASRIRIGVFFPKLNRQQCMPPSQNMAQLVNACCSKWPNTCGVGIFFIPRFRLA